MQPTIVPIAVLICALIGFAGCGTESTVGEADFAAGFTAFNGAGHFERVYCGDEDKNLELPKIYVRLYGKNVVFVPQLAVEDVALLPNFVRSEYHRQHEHEIAFIRPPAKFIFIDGKIRAVTFTHHSDIEIGPTMEGPFVRLPCEPARFEELFGKPVKSRRYQVTAP